MTVKSVLFIVQTFQVQQIKKQWIETQATCVNGQSNILWTNPFLANSFGSKLLLH